MFGKRQGGTANARVQTVIGEGTQVKGTIRSTGVMRIDGFLEGTLEHTGDLIVGPQGRLVATVHTKSLALAGELRGDAHVEERLELLPTARLYGDVAYSQIIIHEGAIFEGRSQRKGGGAPPPSEVAATEHSEPAAD